jgi:hypothetical protein
MTVFRTILAAAIAGLVLSCGANAQTQAPSDSDPAIAVAKEKRAAERQKLAGCNKEADEQKVMVRDRTKFLIACMDR